jgi:hypothetical protein
MNDCKSLIFLVIFYLNTIFVFAQNDFLKNNFGIEKIEKIFYNNDYVNVIFQDEELIFVNRNSYPEYSSGLPDSLPNIADGKFMLVDLSTDINNISDTNIREIGYYKNFKKDSVCSWYFNGAKYKEKKYFKNELIHLSQWDDDGLLIIDIHFKDGLNHGLCRFIDENSECVYAIANFDKGVILGSKINYCDIQDTSLYKIIHYNLNKSKIDKIESHFRNDTLIFELFKTKKYLIKKENGIEVEKIELYPKTKKNKIKEPKVKLLKHISFDPTFQYLDKRSYKTLDQFVNNLNLDSIQFITFYFYSKYLIKDVEPKWMNEVINYIAKKGVPKDKIKMYYFENKTLDKSDFRQRIEYKIIYK